MYECVPDAAVLRIATRPGLPTPTSPDPDGDPERLRGWLADTWNDPEFAEAVQLASPALTEQVHHLVAAPGSPDRRAVARAATATLRYLLRATSRATPFGLFAGVAALHVGDACTVRLGRAHRPVVRVDHDWVTAAAAKLAGEVRDTLPVALDGRTVIRDGRLLLTRRDLATPDSTVSIRLSAAVAAATRLTRDPIPFGELRQRLHHEFPTAAAPTLERVLAGLLDHGVLTTALTPLLTCPQPLRHTITAATAAGAAGGVLDQLHAVDELLTRHAAAEPGARAGLRGAAATRMRSLAAHPAPLGVDLLADVDVTVPRAVTTEAAAAAAALVALAPHPRPPVWRSYHRLFLDRYGVGAAVPLLELLHTGTGLGYPAGYRDTHLPVPGVPRSGRGEQRAALLTRLAHTAAWERRREILLTDTDLRDLDQAAAAAEPDVAPQPHTDLRVEVHAATRAALDAGRFLLLVVGASRAAGTITGRFLDLFDPADTDRMTAALAGMPTATRDARRVQLSGPPTAATAAMIAHGSRVLPGQLVVGGHPAAGALRPADLAVAADPAGLYLQLAATGQPVEPTMFNALELVRCADPTLRFLCEIATASTTACAPFTWDAAQRGLPYLPRLRYGRTVLSPARWCVHTADVSGAAGPGEWRAWQQRWAVPDTVLLDRYDQRLRLDLRDPAHLQLLTAALTGRDRVTLLEAPADDAFGWIDHHAHELVLPMAGVHPATHPTRPRPTAAAAGARATRAPGGAWLSARLDCGPTQQAAVLTRRLPALLATLPGGAGDRAWFLRLTDPVHHLRLRWPLTGPDQFGDAAARLAAWVDTLTDAGLVGEVHLDTYRPELDRFGDGPAMAAAEHVFAADSAAVLAQLALTDTAAVHLAAALTAASMLDLATALHPTPDDGRAWVLAHAPRTSTPPPAPVLRAAAIDLAHPDHPAVAGLPGGDRVLQAWWRRRVALCRYRHSLLQRGVDPATVLPDLLHLHHARVAGPDLARERDCLVLARAAALSQTVRSQVAS